MPMAQISPSAPGSPTHGLVSGMPYSPFGASVPAGSMRRILPDGSESRWGMSCLDAVPAVADREVEQAVVVVTGLGGGVEVDLLDGVDLAGEAVAEQLSRLPVKVSAAGSSAVHSVTTLCTPPERSGWPG